MAPAHTHTQRLHPSLLCSPSAGVATHTGSSKITSPSTIQNQHRHPSRRKDLSCQHGLPVALPSTLKHGIVHALIFLVCSQPFVPHIPRWAGVHKSTPQKATVTAHALAMSVCVCMDPLLTRAGRQPAAGALVPVHRLQHGKRKWPIPDALIPTSSTNTLVASRHSSAHPGMLKSDVELPAMPQSPHTCRVHQRRHTNHKQHPSHVIRTSFRHTATRQTEVFVTPTHLPTQSHSPCATHGSSSHVFKQMFFGSVLSTCCGGK
ncbi:hypothetical protein ECC02_008747 [Trypanosoma cruzi]|uniref:Uncharacterized protein n=1 Tax=Trypanosoma cruzi TaxID=5693 RepID=A0A7J6XI43_TRYCR|nr:hypothetical protein ECC02_013347 [Trypanosoma cruzi]KAF5218317.1 hypothetical protein ECC02_008747 [Trypanosoma cruzi]